MLGVFQSWVLSTHSPNSHYAHHHSQLPYRLIPPVQTLSPLSNTVIYSIRHFVLISNSKCTKPSPMVFSLKSGLIPVFLNLIKGTTSIQLFKPQTSVIPLSYHSIYNPCVLLIFLPMYYLIYLLLAISPKLTYYYFSPRLQ